MKKIALLLALFYFTVACHVVAQTKTGKTTSAVTVVKEENKGDAKSKTYGECTTYLITFKDGITGKIWQAKKDGQWWGSSGGYKDVGPFTKEKAIKWLHDYKVSCRTALVTTGAVVAAGVIAHSSKSTSSTTSPHGKKTAINLNQKKKTSININNNQ